MTTALDATITGGTITTDKGKSVAFATPILGYLGDPLFCKILVSGSTLIVLIDKDGPSQLGPFELKEPATKVSVTVRSQASMYTWPGLLASPYTGTKFTFAVEISSDFRSVSFALKTKPVPVAGAAPIAPAVVNAAGSDTELGFIAIQAENQSGTFELFFLPNPPQIANYQRLTKATIIPPAQPPGSIGGPMGVALTS